MKKNNKTKIGIVGLCGQSIFMKIDHFHKPEETVHASEIYQEVGGKGYNQAVAVKRLGGEPFFLGAVGEDISGKHCCDYLIKQKINFHIIKKVGQTALAVILCNKKGHNQVTVYPGVALEENDLSSFYQEVANCDFLLLNQEVPPAVITNIVTWAEANDKKIIFNPTPVTSFSQQIANKVWLITPNWHEVRQMFALHDIHTIEELIDILPNLSFSRMVVTLGKEGALVLENGKVTHLPALKVNAIDTTGAGDVFNAALVVAMGENKTLLEATKFALIASGLSVTRQYVLASIPFREELLKI